MSMNFLAVIVVTIVPNLLGCDVSNMVVMKTRSHQVERVLNLKSESIENLRLKVVYDPSFENLRNKEDIKKYAVEPAVEYLQRTLKAKNPLSTPLRIDRFCVGGTFFPIAGGRKLCENGCTNEEAGMKIPDKYLTKCFYEKNGEEATSGEDGLGALNTDIIIFITAKNCAKSVLARSRFVGLDHDTDRPVAGILHICNGTFLRMNDKYRQENARNTILHEFFHILGFSSQLYAFYHDEHGNPKTPRNVYGYPTLGQLNLDGGRIFLPHHNTFAIVDKDVVFQDKTIVKKVAILRGPAVVREARSHFGCQNLTGIFLEDFGLKVNAYSHLESNYFQRDMMLIADSIKMYVSRISLAVLEDSGWYTVRMDEADNTDFGKNLGCDFLTKSCYQYIREKDSKKSIYPYCASVGEQRCSRNRNQTERCSLRRITNNNVPDMNKYFSDKSLVSTDESVDYCPMFTVYSARGCQQTKHK